MERRDTRSDASPKAQHAQKKLKRRELNECHFTNVWRKLHQETDVTTSDDRHYHLTSVALGEHVRVSPAMPAPNRTFGLTSNGGARGRGTFRKRGNGRGGGASASFQRKSEAHAAASASLTKGAFDDVSAAEDRLKEAAARDEIDARLGFERLDQGPSRQAWLVNMHPTIMPDDGLDSPTAHASGKSAVDFYFIQDDASMFKVTMPFAPYFLLGCRPGTESHVEEWIKRKFEGLVAGLERQRKEDLKLPNHLVGHNRLLIKLSFHNVQDLLTVRRELLPLAEKAQKTRDAIDTYADVLADEGGGESSSSGGVSAALMLEMEGIDARDDDEGMSSSRAKARRGAQGGQRTLDPEECITDLREYDVPYYLRMAIDNGELMQARCISS